MNLMKNPSAKIKIILKKKKEIMIIHYKQLEASIYPQMPIAVLTMIIKIKIK